MERWNAVCDVSSELGVRVRPGLTIQIEGEAGMPGLGYPFTKQLLAENRSFTALLAFNDSSAIGAIRAINEAGLRVPEDISVVGFDDIQSAAYSNPPLTTIRQPLLKMGEIAARTLLSRIDNPESYLSGTFDRARTHRSQIYSQACRPGPRKFEQAGLET